MDLGRRQPCTRRIWCTSLVWYIVGVVQRTGGPDVRRRGSLAIPGAGCSSRAASGPAPGPVLPRRRGPGGRAGPERCFPCCRSSCFLFCSACSFLHLPASTKNKSQPKSSRTAFKVQPCWGASAFVEECSRRLSAPGGLSCQVKENRSGQCSCPSSSLLLAGWMVPPSVPWPLMLEAQACARTL